MSVCNSIGDGHQHICRKGRFVPVAIIYGKTLMADLHGKCLPDSTEILPVRFLHSRPHSPSVL
ncbi:hypothetical protein DYJ25_02895 [Prevotella denticola]|nr:hypothetical protein DYJ25_02895 [Prevotella denticola]